MAYKVDALLLSAGSVARTPDIDMDPDAGLCMRDSLRAADSPFGGLPFFNLRRQSYALREVMPFAGALQTMPQ